VKTQMARNDVNEIVIATDAGREGELVARWIIEKANIRKKINRLWISSVTDKAITAGFNNLKAGHLYENLYASAKSRAYADWYVGINATRALTTKYNAQLSCGRVQTPTLAIIAKRESEIRNFQPKTFYGIQVLVKNIIFTWYDKLTNDRKTFNETYRNEVITKLNHRSALISQIKTTHKFQVAPCLYNLTLLQRDANRIYGFSPKETLAIMQSLYEYHKILTYPRTDSNYLTTDIVPTLKERLQAIKNSPYHKTIEQILQAPIKANKAFVDDKKVSDHHAIIPTEEQLNINKLNDREFKIYDLVIKRFLAVLYPAFEYDEIKVTLTIGDEQFNAQGRKIINQGFKEIYNYHDEEMDLNLQILPELKLNEKLKLDKIISTTGQTNPPRPFTEDTLLQVMENPVKYMDSSDKTLLKTISETGGLGTVATRADIIEKLFNTFLIEKKGQDIFITSKGRQLLDLVPEDLKSPALTAEWEQKLSQIAKGELNESTYITEMKKYAQIVVKEIKNSDKLFKHDNLSTKQCPKCGKFLLEVKTKDYKMLTCQDRSCNYRQTVAKMTNARCPVCHKRLELYGEAENQIFICKCGHKEKLATYNARMKKEKNKLSKKDVAKYINKINKENDVAVNSSLADALKELKLKNKAD
jgi:DNA topoisomerase-3